MCSKAGIGTLAPSCLEGEEVTLWLGSGSSRCRVGGRWLLGRAASEPAHDGAHPPMFLLSSPRRGMTCWVPLGHCVPHGPGPWGTSASSV